MSKWGKLLEVLDRYCDKIYPSKKAFLDKIKKDRVSIYLGIDPTGPDLHLGHSTNFFVLRELQKAGHTVIFLIGDFTARIGDPTDKETTRKRLTTKEVLENAKTYQKQASKLLDFEGENPAQLKFNSQWLKTLSAEEIIELGAHVTVDQLLKRSMFRKRRERGQEIYVHEFIYPLLQGYDSVSMGVDAEMGGTDQTFNMLVGRDLVKSYSGKEKYVVTTKLLENPETGKKVMSKSEGSYVSLQDRPADMYAKIMALPDEVVITCLKLCTTLPLAGIKRNEREVESGRNPIEVKKVLADEVVRIYHGSDKAQKAREDFEKTVQGGELPNEIKEQGVKDKEWAVEDLLVELELASSKSEAKRLVNQGGVEIDGSRLPVQGSRVRVEDGMVVRVGKRGYVRIRTR